MRDILISSIPLAALMLTLFGLAMAFIKYYIDAKIDPMANMLRQCIDYLILHEGKIGKLEAGKVDK